jgi:hypothetical protein
MPKAPIRLPRARHTDGEALPREGGRRLGRGRRAADRWPARLAHRHMPSPTPLGLIGPPAFVEL